MLTDSIMSGFRNEGETLD